MNMINEFGVRYEVLTPYSPNYTTCEMTSEPMKPICGTCGQYRGNHYTNGRGITRCPILVNGNLKNPESYSAEHHNQTFITVSESKFHNHLDDSLFSID